MILPLFTPEQAVGDEVVVAERAIPDPTGEGTMILQPRLSRIVTLCDPAATPVNVWGLAPGTKGAPSSDQVNGAVPDNAVTVIVPLFTVGQLVGVVELLPLTPGPVGTIVGIRILQLKLSRIDTLCPPPDRLVNVKGLAPGTKGPPSIDQVKGGVPVKAVTVIVPEFTPGHAVAVAV